MSHRFLRDATWFSAAQAVSGAMMLAYTMVAARLLGGGDGTYSLFQSVMGLYSVFFMFGFPLNVATVHVMGTATEEDRSTTLGSCLAVASIAGSVLGTAVLAASPLLARFLHTDHITPFYTIAALLIVSYILTVSYGALQGRNEYRCFAFLKVTETFLSLTIGTFLMLLQLRVPGAIGGYLGGMGFVTLYFLLRVNDCRFNARAVFSLLSFRSLAMPLALSFVLVVALSGPMVISRWRLDETASEVYAALFSFRNILQPFALAVSLPLYSSISAGREEKGMLRTALAVVALLGSAFVAVSLTCPSLCVRVLLGPEFAPAAHYLWSYALVLGFFMLGMVLMFHAAAKGKLALHLLPIPVVGVLAMIALPELTVTKVISLQVISWISYITGQMYKSLHTTRNYSASDDESAFSVTDLGGRTHLEDAVSQSVQDPTKT